jgi:hypothetical protein
MDIKITTENGGIYIIYDATAFGLDAVVGRTESDPELRIYKLRDTDTLVKL